MHKKHFSESELIGLGVFIRLLIENVDPFSLEKQWHSEYVFSGCLFDEMQVGEIKYGRWFPIMENIKNSAKKRTARRSIIFKKTRFKKMRTEWQLVPYVVKIDLVTDQSRNCSFGRWHISSITVAKQIEGIWKAREYTWYYEFHYGNYLHLHPIRGEETEISSEALFRI